MLLVDEVKKVGKDRTGYDDSVWNDNVEIHLTEYDICDFKVRTYVVTVRHCYTAREGYRYLYSDRLPLKGFRFKTFDEFHEYLES